MKPELLLVRYGEIALKSKRTRTRFENKLIQNIKEGLNNEKISFKIKREWGRIYIYTREITASVPVLKKIFGIKSFSPSLKTETDLDLISKLAINISKEKINRESTFALRVRRTGTHDFTSQEVAIQIGNEIVNETKADVDLENPDLEIYIEIRQNETFLFTKKIHSVAGLPVSTQGNILSLIVKPESLLSTWYLMKRGCKPLFLVEKKFDKNKIKNFQKKWYLNTDIYTFDGNKYDKIEKIKRKNELFALVTAHTLNKRRKEDISDIKKIKNMTNLPVLTPLVALTEEEINKKCREIGIK